MRLHRIGDVRARLGEERRAGRSVGLVPTMGAFHEGHLSLMRAARAENDVVLVSLFVNPTQFGPGEDLDRYPRDVARDLELADGMGADVLFVPAPEEMYPPGFQTWVEVEDLGSALEGAVRPGHFRGVATVCLKLFNIVQPDRAYFGQKDAQQVAVLRRMLRDLDLPLELRVLPIVRDPDGLALSSRNAYLSHAQRAAALALPRALAAGYRAWQAGDDPVRAAARILGSAGGVDVDYVAVADFDPPTLAAAVRVGTTHLVDNVPLVAGQSGPTVIEE
ncbi:MAG TPA: pantoate--beta-alanine ligase [Candidatus Limnocylindria bacterium]|nr:pantoate--beta-alanine ligase [Candidatus Limnocylindria bacterium]